MVVQVACPGLRCAGERICRVVLRRALQLAGACLAAVVWLPAMPAAAAAPSQAVTSPAERPRLVVLTDIGNEPDDAESLVRLLLYANEIDLEALVATTSRHRPRDPDPALIAARVAAYGEVAERLRRHADGYPDAAELMGRVLTGSPVYGMTGVGAGHNTTAARRIVELVDSADPRPLWIAVWGGAADLAQALWHVADTRPPAEVARFVAKLRVYSISDQDDAGPWARAQFPQLFWIASVHGFTHYALATWTGISAPLPGADGEAVSREWLARNIHGRGPLGALYPMPAYLMEGDTPSILPLIANGLNVPERPDWGSWGGRYGKVSNMVGLWTNVADSVRGVDGTMQVTPQATVWRWRSAFQNDFAARIAWSTTDDGSAANHPPAPVLNGMNGTTPLMLRGCAGVPVDLSAVGSTDADDDRLTYRWWWYREASGLFAPELTLSAATGPATQATIGASANVDQFAPPDSYELHVILEVTDAGIPALTRYRRAIIEVPGAATEGGAGQDGCAVVPVPPQHATD